MVVCYNFTAFPWPCSGLVRPGWRASACRRVRSSLLNALPQRRLPRLSSNGKVFTSLMPLSIVLVFLIGRVLVVGGADSSMIWKAPAIALW